MSAFPQNRHQEHNLHLLIEKDEETSPYLSICASRPAHISPGRIAAKDSSYRTVSERIAAHGGPGHLCQHEYPVVTFVLESCLEIRNAAITGGNYGLGLEAVDQFFHLLRPGAAQAMVETVQFQPLYTVQDGRRGVQVR